MSTPVIEELEILLQNIDPRCHLRAYSLIISIFAFHSELLNKPFDFHNFRPPRPIAEYQQVTLRHS